MKYTNFYLHVTITTDDWCKGTIVEIPKKGNPTNYNNWRGITLLSVPSKIFRNIISKRPIVQTVNYRNLHILFLTLIY